MRPGARGDQALIKRVSNPLDCIGLLRSALRAFVLLGPWGGALPWPRVLQDECTYPTCSHTPAIYLLLLALTDALEPSTVIGHSTVTPMMGVCTLSLPKRARVCARARVRVQKGGNACLFHHSHELMTCFVAFLRSLQAARMLRNAHSSSLGSLSEAKALSEPTSESADQ